MDQSSIYKAVKSLSNGAGSESSSVNRFFDCDIVNKTGLDISVCNKFNKLISSLCSSELGVTRNKPLNDSDYKYLNFWANYKINISGFFGNDYIAAFYDSVSSEIEQCFTINKLKGALQYKEKSYMEKIKTIDYLYRNYYDMRDIILSSSTEKFGKCLEYSQNCFNEYKKVIDIDQDSNKNFYDALINFKKNYDQLAHKALNRNRSYAEYIVKMPEYSTSNMILYSMENDRKIYKSKLFLFYDIKYLIIKIDSYKFFNGIEKYIKDAEKLDSHGDLTEFESSCNSASKYHHAIDSKIICQKFQYLYKLLSTKESSQTQSLDEKDYDFINFWLNYALKDFRSNDPGIVKKIFEDVLKNGTKVKTDSQLQNKICYINDDIYNNMDIVFTLYYNYDKIYKDNTVVCNDKESCEVYTKQCLEKYKQGIYQCPENDNVFCNKLHDLKNKYEERQDVRSPSGFKISEILMLPT
ncbi:hypothetical protein PVMG_04873 [Plasmodium vivax Mauritania I]|uniref:PIR Superfamily Protein n=1 Tax=Plasmodium vivax Mauritania I TaxID=1035515 RepID=A0A0J9T7Y5_PLAVI|nr:hypothetical protein PVMG_04873 [Plasmodium vivax Mauritania I]